MSTAGEWAGWLPARAAITGLACTVGGAAVVLAAAHPAAVVAAMLAGKAVPAGVFGVPGVLVRNEDLALNAGNGDESHGASPVDRPGSRRGTRASRADHTVAVDEAFAGPSGQNPNRPPGAFRIHPKPQAFMERIGFPRTQGVKISRAAGLASGLRQAAAASGRRRRVTGRQVKAGAHHKVPANSRASSGRIHMPSS